VLRLLTDGEVEDARKRIPPVRISERLPRLMHRWKRDGSRFAMTMPVHRREFGAKRRRLGVPAARLPLLLSRRIMRAKRDDLDTGKGMNASTL
jgi:hypothetical protein